MPKCVLGIILLMMTVPAWGQTSVLLQLPHDCERLADGTTLIADGGLLPTGSQSHVLEIDTNAHLKKTYSPAVLFVHSCKHESNENVMITDTNHNRVVEVNSSESIVWDSDDYPLSDGSTLMKPTGAEPLTTGNILVADKDNHRIIEITRTGSILWQFGFTGIPGNDSTHLNNPVHAESLQDGSTLIADTNNNRVIQVNNAGSIIWFYTTGINLPRDAEYLPDSLSSDGLPAVLITDSNNNRVIEVSYSTKSIIWSYATGLNRPFNAERLASKNTLIADSLNKRVIEVNLSGVIVWQYPTGLALQQTTIYITNPTSSAQLYCHVHKPQDASPTKKYPGFIWVPGGDGWGSQADANGLYELFAGEGFVVMHLDPDGRGNSSGTENYSGFIHQDGMHAVLQYLAGLPEVDAAKVGIVSSSFGVTMSSGVLSRYLDNPPVKFLVDFEGPASRCETASVYGGHLNHDPSDEPWWAEREALQFMDNINVRYYRIQTTQDHNPNITDNHHCVQLANEATSSIWGGNGIAPWTRVNNSGMNYVDTYYDISPSWQCAVPYNIPMPPLWLYESTHLNAKTIQYVREAVECDTVPPSSIGNTLMILKGANLLLQWQGLSEPDLLGYSVYRSNTPIDVLHATHRLGGMQPTTTVIYYEDLPPISQSAYYKVTGIDICTNEGQ